MSEDSAPMDIDNTPQLSPEEIKNQANEQYKQGHYEEAVNLYSQAIDASPQTSTYYNNRAAALMMQKKYKDAANDCRTATELDPQNVKAFLRGGKCHLNMGNLEEAGRQYNRAMQIDVNSAQRDYNNLQHVLNYMAQVTTFMANNQWGLARNSLDRAISFVDSDVIPVKWRVMQAECALGDKNYSEASRIVNSLVRLNSQNPDALFLRARVFYSQGENQKTVAHCQEALRCDPDFTKARSLLKRARAIEKQKEEGNNAFKANQLDEAYDAYTAALDIDPTNDHMNSRLYSNRAAVLQKQKKFEEALLDCDKAIELDEEFYKAYSRRAGCYMETEQYEEAVRDYKKLTEVDASNREYHNLLRKAELELKKSLRKDYYKILGLTKTASETEIKKAYRKLALQYHPDKNAGDDKAEARFKEVGEAYAILSDPEKKARFDSGADLDGGMGMGGGGFPGGGMDVNEVIIIFAQMFAQQGGGGGFGGGFPGGGFGGGGRRQQQQGGYSFHFG
ncbi:DnaJ homolog subfamily C member 7-like [Mucor ambiguus]|uniref:DnaJ homolog subfamily C member 7-like n=1 Tax=Mucor ambiguus TaxID=91626 RepID=A0A0C9MNQ0_9FUNG|nr:DnaJ homolog subfamily C member 7-like [Mucor ambiguus]